MPISDWNLDASEELGYERALEEEQKKCSSQCTARIAKDGLCNRYCRNGMCTEVTDIKRQQIREDKQAVGYLCDDELYSLIGIKRAGAYKTIKELSGMDWRQLTNEGFTDKDSLRLLTFFEFARRLELPTEPKPKINSPENVYRLLYPQMREMKKEIFVVICLDTKNQTISKETISIGSLNANIIHPREVFKSALLASAAHIIVAHNHPSGDPVPSKEDIEITKKLVETGKIMGIDVLDHVVIGDGRHFSMKEAGHI